MTQDLPAGVVDTVICGEATAVLKTLPECSVHCCVSSPPYWGLRDYGIPPTHWPEISFSPMPGLPPMTIPAMDCVHGLEDDIWAYVGHEVQVFREVWRVLRDDGTCWLNLGDSYSSSGGRTSACGPNAQCGNTLMEASPSSRSGPRNMNGLSPKQLVGVPWRVAYALQADGWYLRSACPWMKKNPMPESCDDRPTTTVESIFLFSKKADYYYDSQAVKLASTRQDGAAADFKRETKESLSPGQSATQHRPDRNPTQNSGLRLRRSTDWFFESWKGLLLDGDGGPLAFVVNPKGTTEAHFATFPPKLVEPMILVSTSEKGCCPKCGAPWRRVVKKDRVATRSGNSSKVYRDPVGSPYEQHSGDIVGNRDPFRHCTTSKTVGWEPSCVCGDFDPVPCVVLDPFGGSGTVGWMAAKLRRHYILIDLHPTYADEIASARLLEAEVGVPVREQRAGQMALFGEEKRP